MSESIIKNLIKQTVIEMIKTEEITISTNVLKGKEEDSDIITTEIVLWENGLGETIQRQERESESKYFKL